MRSRSTVTAALALAAVTILAVAACGSTVSGSAAVNTAAAVSVESSTSASSQSTESTESTQSTETADQTTPTALPTDLSELTALLSGLPTDLSLPSDLSDLSDLSIPSDLGDLNIPGYNPACVTVALAYGSILLATYPALLGGDGAFDATGLQKAISDLSGQAPPEIAGDIQALGEVASEANGKTLTDVSELFDGDKFKTASDHIEAWTNTNCGG